MAISLSDVRDFIRFANKDDLETVSDILSSRWKHLQAEAAMNFLPGDSVYFIHGKRSPRRITGKVVGSSGKVVMVLEDGVNPGIRGWNWRVSGTLLKKR